MFEECESFNQSLDNWDVSNETETIDMFNGTSMTQLPDWYHEENEDEYEYENEYEDENEYENEEQESAMKIQSKQISSKEMNIVLPEEIFDVINQENINVKDFLGDSNNILFMFNNQFYPLSKDAIKTQLNPSTTFYGCNKATGLIGAENVNRDVIYFNLRSIGLPIPFVEAGYIQSILEEINSNQNIYVLEETEKMIPSVVSLNVLLQQGSWVSAAHCQEGQGGKVYEIFKVVSTQQNVGGKTRKTRKGRKARKGGKTRKTKKTRKIITIRKSRKMDSKRTRKTKHRKY